MEAFLPLQAGNRWTYEVEVNGKKRSQPMVVEITKMVIKNFRSYYLFNRFPFAAVPVPDAPLIRYDRKSQTFYQLVDDQDVELYPDEGEHRTEVKAGESSGGSTDLRVLKVRFRSAIQAPRPGASTPPTDEIVFKYGEGVASGQRTTDLGIEKFVLIKTAANVFSAGKTPPAQKTLAPEPAPAPLKPLSPYASEGPRLEISVEQEGGKVKFVLRVQNKHDKIVPLNFGNDQSYDFIITSDSSAPPVWRWSANHYFSKVRRSLALRPGESFEYSAEWNGQDLDHQPVPAGKYQVIGILTTNPELRTTPKEFNYTLPPSS